jgi:hypothetical protein
MTVWAYCFLLVHHAMSDDRGDSAGFDSYQGYANRDDRHNLSGASNVEIASLVINTSFGYMCFAFLAAQLVPLCLHLVIDEGPAAASKNALMQILTMSPVFFVFQSKIISSFLTSEITFGGAEYIDAGRGLESTRNQFVHLYRTFAPTCIYDGCEIVLFVLVGCIAGGNALDLSLGWWVSISLICGSWIFSPVVFNPYSFTLQKVCADYKSFWAWLTASGERGPKESWVAWIDGAQKRRLGCRSSVYISPGYHCLIAMFSLVLFTNKLNSHNLLQLATSREPISSIDYIWSCLPLMSGLVTSVAARAVSRAATSLQGLRSAATLVVLVAIVQAAELYIIMPDSLRGLSTIWPAFVMHKL